MAKDKIEIKIDKTIERLNDLYGESVEGPDPREEYLVARGTAPKPGGGGTKITGTTIEDVKIDKDVQLMDETEPLVIKGGREEQARITDILEEGKFDKSYVMGPDGSPIFKDWDQNEVAVFNKILKDLTLGDLEQYTGPLSKLTKQEELFESAQFSDAVGRMFADKIDKVAGKTSMDQLKQAAKELDNTRYYKELLRQDGSSLSKEAYMRALLETQILTNVLKSETDRLLTRGFSTDPVIMAKEKANYNKMFSYLQLLVVEGAADTRVSAQKMAALKNQGKGEFTQGDWVNGLIKIVDVINADGKVVGEATVEMSDDTFQEVVNRFHRLSNDQLQYAAELSKSKGPGWFDALAEIYQNSLLFHPISLIVNTTGGVVMNLAHLSEMVIAAGINKIPGLESVDGTTFTEIADVIASIKHGAARGWDEAVAGAKDGKHISQYGGKMDFRYEGNALSGNLLGDNFRSTPVGASLGHFLDYSGAIVNFPKQSMIFTDEITKGYTFDMELASMARKEYFKELNKHGDKAKATEAMELFVMELPDAKRTELYNKMAERTFQADLPDSLFGAWQAMGKIAKNPVMKFFMPFYKTIANIMFEVTKRNPATAWMMPSVWKDFKAGGNRAQMAASRMLFGSGVMLMVGEFVYDPDGSEGRGFVITGGPPLNKDDARAFREKNLLPYSFAWLQEDGTYTSVSYAKIEPISRIIGMTADAMNTITATTGGYDASAEEIIHGLLNAGYEYFASQPFVDVWGEMGDFFGVTQSNFTGSIPEVMMSKMINKMVDMGGVVLNPVGRMTKYIPNANEVTNVAGDGFSDYMLRMGQNFQTMDYGMTSEQMYGESMWAKLLSLGDATTWAEYENSKGNIPYATHEFYKNLNKRTYESPFTNTTLNPRLTEFGEIIPKASAYGPVPIAREKQSCLQLLQKLRSVFTGCN